MPPNANFSEVEQVLNDAIAAGAFPGAAYGILHPGGLTVGTAGRFTYEEASPLVKPDTIYDIASVTKVVATTSMTMRLFERGTLNLDQPLHQVIPEFISDEPSDSPKKTVTIRMLLAHSSGLPAWAPLYKFCSTSEELLAACYRVQLTSTPSRQTAYSDIGFILLGEALQRLADEPLDTFVSREILSNAEMSNTLFRPPAQRRSNIPPAELDLLFRKRMIQGEVQDENCWVMSGVAGHAGLFSSVPDLLKFADCMLSGSRQLFWPETIQFFTRREAESHGTSRALGWDTPSPEHSSSGHFFSTWSAGHLGFSGTSLWIDFERRVAAVLLTNRCWPSRANNAIRTIRPLFHDAVMRGLGVQPANVLRS